jgi:adenosine deaminase
MQDYEALERITNELVQDVAADGTRYVEIRWAPALHVGGGLSLRASIEAVVDGMWSGIGTTEGRVAARLIAVALRSHPPDTSFMVARIAAEFRDAGLTGFDFAGPEEAYPDPTPHLAAFEEARSKGLGITIHAGEWDGPDQVRRSLIVDPSRIAHGAPAAADSTLLDELKARPVTLDLCPTSNVQSTSVASLAEHPLARLARAGVPVTLSTDDRTVSDVTLPDEFERVHRVLGLSPAELWRINRHALDVAFLHHDEALRGHLKGEFDAFAAAEPLLQESV